MPYMESKGSVNILCNAAEFHRHLDTGCELHVKQSYRDE